MIFKNLKECSERAHKADRKPGPSRGWSPGLPDMLTKDRRTSAMGAAIQVRHPSPPEMPPPRPRLLPASESPHSPRGNMPTRDRRIRARSSPAITSHDDGPQL